MSWFNDQVAYRLLKDDEALSETYINIAGAVMGRRIQQAWQDESVAVKSAIEDVCKFYHLKARDIPASMKDPMDQMDYVFQPHGIMKRNVKLKDDWYKYAVGPMLGTRASDGKMIALIPGKAGGYTFLDIDSGRRVKVNKSNANLIDEEAIVFYKPLPLRQITMKDLISYMAGCLAFSDLLWFFVALGAVTLLGMLTPKLNNILFAEVVQYSSVSLLMSVIIFMACITISIQVINAIKGLLLQRITTKLNLSVQSATMMRMFSLPAGFFKDYTAGELSQVVTYMNQLCNLLCSAVFSTGFTGLFSLIYITQIFRYTPALVAPALLITLVTLLFSIATVLLQMRISREQMGLAAKERGMVYSMITGMQKIRLAGAEKRAFSRWGMLYSQEAELLYNPPMFLKMNTVFTTAISLGGTIILYYMAVKSGVSVADYYAFNAAYAYVSAAFVSLAGIAQVAASIKPVLEIIRPILEATPELEEGQEMISKLNGGIELSHIDFRYEEGQKLILDDLSLRIRPGQYVAIVGESGCGKTTLLRVLLGFEKPQKGAVYYDGKNIDKLDKKSLRRKIGVVMQGGKLIWGDIYSNITISAPWLDLDAAWEAAEIAGIAEDIREMPMGMQTIIQEGGGGISGGQKQRIMIARAVAPKPKVLFLDEATSALDNITQKHVSDAMDKMKCTRVVIAHRLSTIRQCDRIIMLKDGRIVEDGTYDKLIEKNGLFADLVKRQQIDG